MKLSLSLSKSDHDSRREISELNNNNFPCAAEIHFLNIVFGGEKNWNEHHVFHPKQYQEDR
jgi:hypothetical protein